MKFLLPILALFVIAFSGCGNDEKETTYQIPSEWEFKTEVRTNMAKLEGRVETIEKMISPRTLPKPKDKLAKEEKPKKKVTLASMETRAQDLDDVIDTEGIPQPQSVVESTPLLQSSAPPVQVQTEVQTFQSNAPTYSSTGQTFAGPAVQSGYKTVQKTRRVAKTVYEEVPYEEKVPVLKEPIYETQTAQVPYQVAKTVMKTEQRTRTKTVMVPQQVQENYAVQVPETVMETKYRTVSKQVKIGDREVTAPVSSAPPSYASAPIQRPAPPVQYSAPPVQYSAPPVRFASAPAVQYSSAPSCPPQYSAAPQQVCEPQYSAAPQYASAPSQQMVCENCKPANSFSSASPVSTAPQRTFATPFRSTFNGAVKSQATSDGRLFQRARRNGGTGVTID